MKKRVITISREFGSGGHSIGKIQCSQWPAKASQRGYLRDRK